MPKFKKGLAGIMAAAMLATAIGTPAAAFAATNKTTTVTVKADDSNLTVTVPTVIPFTWVTFKTPQERFCGVVFSHDANRDGGKAGREEDGVTVTRRAMLQRWRLVRMGDGWGRARIGASPYDPCSLRGGLVESVCGNVVHHICSMLGCYN